MDAWEKLVTAESEAEIDEDHWIDWSKHGLRTPASVNVKKEVEVKTEEATADKYPDSSSRYEYGNFGSWSDSESGWKSGWYDSWSESGWKSDKRSTDIWQEEASTSAGDGSSKGGSSSDGSEDIASFEAELAEMLLAGGAEGEIAAAADVAPEGSYEAQLADALQHEAWKKSEHCVTQKFRREMKGTKEYEDAKASTWYVLNIPNANSCVILFLVLMYVPKSHEINMSFLVICLIQPTSILFLLLWLCIMCGVSPSSSLG